jgi:hypothetical protein
MLQLADPYFTPRIVELLTGVNEFGGLSYSSLMNWWKTSPQFRGAFVRATPSIKAMAKESKNFPSLCLGKKRKASGNNHAKGHENLSLEETSKDKTNNDDLQNVVHLTELGQKGFESLFWVISKLAKLVGNSISSMDLFKKPFDMLTDLTTELKSGKIVKLRHYRQVAQDVPLFPTDFLGDGIDECVPGGVFTNGLKWLLSGESGSREEAIVTCEVLSQNYLSKMCRMSDKKTPQSISRGDVFFISLALDIPLTCPGKESLILGEVFTFRFDEESKLTSISSKRAIMTRRIGSSSIAPVYSSCNISLNYAPRNGSCLFISIAHGTNVIEDILREKLSSVIGLPQLICYRAESEACGSAPRSSRQRRSARDLDVGIAKDEYPEFVMETGLKLTTVESLKIAARKKASTDPDGIHKCLWGDWFALHVISDFLEITFLVVDLTPGIN